ncbi:RNA binding protein Nrd1 [Pseudohyphozyma bogoriensis]|nr:RNA binding protein Nrd1 [Pseudohyphozyma bogoriensis]
MSLEEFDRQIKALVSKGKLSPSLVEAVVDLAMSNISSDTHLFSTLWRAHKSASPSSKLTSLYILDAIVREARSRAKKAAAKGKEVESADSAAHAAKGTFATFLAKIEGVLGKMVMDCWENGVKEHRGRDVQSDCAGTNRQQAQRRFVVDF